MKTGRYNFSIRFLLVVVLVAGIAAYIIKGILEEETIDYVLASRGPDIELVSAEFEIVFLACADGSNFRTEGTLLIAGSQSSSATKITHGDFVLIMRYSPRSLQLVFREANVEVRKQSGRIEMQVNGVDVPPTDGKPRIVLSDEGTWLPSSQ